MNLSVKKISFLVSCALLFIGCKKDLNNIGLPQKPQDSIGVFFTDTSTINSWNVINFDSVITSNNNILMLGKENLGELGQISATPYFNVVYTPLPVDLSKITVDSVVLQLKSVYPRDSAILMQLQQPFDVYELPKYFEKRNYLANEGFTSEQLEGFPLLSSGNLKYAGFKNFESKLDNEFGKRLLYYSSDTNNFSSVALKPTGGEKIASFLKQIQFTSSDTSGVIALYYKSDTSSHIKLYYLGYNSVLYYNIDVNREGTKLYGVSQSDMISTSVSDNLGYIQCGTGLNTKLAFPFIQNIKRNKNIIINRAQLIVTPIQDADINIENPDLTAFKTDASNKQISVIGRYNVRYDTARKNYTFDITSYIQSLLVDNLPGNGLIIAPRYAIRGISLDKTIFYDQNIGRAVPAMEDKKMKLLIYYTEI